LLIPGGPAQFGVFQTGVALGLSLFVAPAVVKEAGSVFTFYLYVCQLGTIAILGVMAQRALELDWRAVILGRPGARASTRDETPS
jgi:glycosyltransferase 2 family protein